MAENVTTTGKSAKIDWQSLTDDDFVGQADRQIWLSAFANNNPRAPAHAEVDAAYHEAKRRGKPWLYQRGWNRAAISAGFEPSAADLDAAKEPKPGGEE